VAWWYWRRDAGIGQRVPFRRRAVTAIAALLAFGLLLVPWTVRNIVVTEGQFRGISSNAPGEFLRGYVNAQAKYYLLRQNFGGTDPTGEKWDPEANATEERFLEPYGVAFFRNAQDDTPDWQLETRKDRIEGAEVMRRLLHEPLDFLRKFVVQLATFWYVVETRTKSLLVGAIALFVLALAAAGAVRARRCDTVVWPVILIVMYLNAIYAAILAFARYSMPLYPTLTILAAGGLEYLLSHAMSPAKRSLR